MIRDLGFDGEDWYVVFINEDGTQRNDGSNGYTYTPTAGRNEIIVGTAGDDIIDCSGLDNRYIILGGDGADILKGGNNSDYIFGWVTLNWSEYAQYPCLISDSLDQAVVAGTVQTLYGNGGNDFIYGGLADEIIYGDSENGDNSGSDNISGGAGADTIYGDSKTGNGSGSDNIDGQEGADIIFGDTEYGVGSGNDEIWGSDGNDVIYADSRVGSGSGNDTVYGGAGNDVVYGDSELSQGTGADTIDGGDGDDTLYGDSRVANGSGADQLDGGDGADILFGDSQLGVGSGNDTIYGGSGNDLLYGDSQEGPGSGSDVLTGDDGEDQIFGDSYTAQGSGDDVIVGGWGQDFLVGDSYQGTGTGADRIDGGYDNDVVYGDSVQADGSGNDIILGGDGDDTLAGDSDTGKGSGCDWLDGGAGNDIMYGDSRSGEGVGHDMLIAGEGDDLMYGDTGGPIGLGHDTLVVGPGTDTPAGAGQEFDTIIQADGQAPSYSYEVNGYTAQYRRNADTGAVEAHNNQFNSWDVVGERYWDQAHNAWVTNMGASVTVEYADKTLLYNNYGTDIKIKQDGSWQPYNPDDHYRVEYREDPETGKLLVYNNDLGTWDPYMEEYQPEGANYTVLNEGNTIQIKYADGSVVMLENYGDGAWLNAAETGHHWVQLPGRQIYRDSTGIWYSYGWGQWSYSIDTCATWHEVPMLQFHVVAGSGAVDYFDGHSWTHQNGKLQFFDKNYAMSGWHEMSEFAVEYYDGVGYDGEPITVVEGWETAQSSDPDAPAVLLTLTPAGQQENPAPTDSVITRWEAHMYGQRSGKHLVSWEVPHPSQDYRLETYTGPLSVVCQASNFSRPLNPSDAYKQSGYFRIYRQDVGENVIYFSYSASDCGLKGLVDKLTVIQSAYQGQIDNLVILDHGVPNSFSVGKSRVTPDSFKPVFGVFQVSSDALQFKRLDSIMTDGGQIQHWGCGQASFDPTKVPSGSSSDASVQDAIMTRRMFSTIAFLTNTYVFASSDVGGIDLIKWIDKDQMFEIVGGADLCLEFGVSPDGMSVSSSLCSSAPWDSTKWIESTFEQTRVRSGDPQTWDENRSDFDPSHSGYNPLHVPTYAEEGGTFYRRLYEWFLV